MTSVLVVDDDAPLARALARELRGNGYDSTPVSGYDEALERLAEATYDVVLTDLRMGAKDGLDLILALAESFPTTRPILMSAYATARDSERAKELGAVRVLCKPFDTAEMLQAVERAVECAQGFLGSVHGMSLVDMLQMFHYAQRSVSVHVLGGLPAAIHLRNGSIVHASHGAAEGEAALAQILILPAGSLQTSPLEPVAQTISRQFQPLMLDLMRLLDEARRGPSPELSYGVESVSPADAGAAYDSGFDASGPPESTSRARSVPAAPPERGLLSDACRRTAAELHGDVVCAVVDLDRGRLLGWYAAQGDVRSRSEALARATLAIFRDSPLQGIERLLGDGPMENDLPPHLRRVELTLQGGQFLARATRQGRRVMALLLGRDVDARAARSQLDAVFPLVEALVP